MDFGLFSDIKLRVKSEGNEDQYLQVPCHRFILATNSPVFKAMLTSEMRESREEAVTLYEEDTEALRNLIQTMYHRPLNLTMREVIQLCKVAAKYEVIPVTTHCLDTIKRGLNTSNVGEVFALMAPHPFEAVREACVKKAQEVFRSALSIRHDLPFELVLEVMKCDDLEASEVQIWRFVTEWIRTKMPSVGQGQELLKCVRFEHCECSTAQSMLKDVSSYSSLLPHQLFVERLMCEGYLKKLKGTMRTKRRERKVQT